MPTKNYTPLNTKNYVVRFFHGDEETVPPVEEYVYNTLHDAEHHFNLFIDDDSGLYDSIQLIAWFENTTTILKTMRFVNSGMLP